MDHPPSTPSTPPPAAGWRATLNGAVTAASSALTHAPENAAYGLMAMAPLGAAFGPMAMGLALLGAAVANLCASLVGSGRLAGDAGAALALLSAGLVGTLLPKAASAGIDSPWAVLVLVALAIGGAGLLTALFGALRIGGVIKFTPYPVRVGLTSGIGLLLMESSLPAAMGHGFSSGWPLDKAFLAGAWLVALCAVAITAMADRLGTRVPPVMLGLGAATLLQATLTRLGVDGLGPSVGVPTLPAAWFGGPAAAGWSELLAQPGVPGLLGGFALTAAIVVSLDALLVASIVDGRLRRSRNANRELLAQGMANIASAAVGGLPASPAVPVSLGLVAPNPQQRHIVLVYGVVLMLIVLAVPSLLGVLPVSAVGGVLSYLGALMLADSLWLAPLEGWRLRRSGPSHSAQAHRMRQLASNWAVTASVALSAVVLGLGPAVLIGASFAVLLFVRSNMRDVVRRSWSGASRSSLKTRPIAVVEVLRREGHRITLLELEGALFFGTADALRERLHELLNKVDTAVLDLHRVTEVDVTAARILHEIAEDWDAANKTLVFAEWPSMESGRGLLQSVGSAVSSSMLRFADTVDHALEQAEDRLLQQLDIEHHGDEPLLLADTLIARGLNAEELLTLAAQTTRHVFTRGEVLFRAGDPGEIFYVILKGEIGLRVPGTSRRLASFAPGVTIGEMSVLAHTPRSAEAFAESEVIADGVSAQAFQHLMQQHPALAFKLCTNISLHLADRVRMLTADLAGLLSRGSAATTEALRTAPDVRPQRPT